MPPIHYFRNRKKMVHTFTCNYFLKNFSTNVFDGQLDIGFVNCLAGIKYTRMHVNWECPIKIVYFLQSILIVE